MAEVRVGRIRQNLVTRQNLTEFGNMAEFGRKLIEYGVWCALALLQLLRIIDGRASYCVYATNNGNGTI